jgi:aminomethyltransferase
MVVNAGTREKDLAWLRQQAGADGVAVEPRLDLAMIAVQGPNARQKAASVHGPGDRGACHGPGKFSWLDAGRLFVARTGYTGEDGWEIMLPAGDAPGFWSALRDAGVRPCGLGARDTLRLEAGMNLYGNDMDETTSPLESGLGWTIAWEPQDRDFIGRGALTAQKASGIGRKFVGLLVEERAVLRSHQKVIVPAVGEGEVTSGTFSPTLERSIGFAPRSGPGRRSLRGGNPRTPGRGASRAPALRAQRQDRHRAVNRPDANSRETSRKAPKRTS